MCKIPVVAFAAFSGTGKTTLIEQLVTILRAKGLRIAVIKHDVRNLVVDKEGKDSWRFAKAGADMTIVSCQEMTAVMEYRERTLEDNLAAVHDVDLIMVEGYKNKNIPQIGISRKATGKGLPASPERYIAVVTDEEFPELKVPCFGLDDVEDIAGFILSHMDKLIMDES